MTLEAIKQAIQQLPEPDRLELAGWLEDEVLLTGDPAEIHGMIGEGLAELDRGEGLSPEASRAWVQDQKRHLFFCYCHEPQR